MRFFKNNFSIAKLLFSSFSIVVILFSSNICSAQTASNTSETEPETFFFSFTLKSRLNPEFKLCVPLTEEIPFQIEWVDQNIKSSLTALLKKPIEGKYPLRVTVTEEKDERRLYEGMEEPKIILDNPYKSNFIASSLFNKTYEKHYNLSRKGCNFEEGSFYWMKKELRDLR